MPDRISIQQLRFDRLRIPFKVAFRHASADRAETSSVWIEAMSASGVTGFGESCPRPYVTGETLATAHDFFVRHEASLRHDVNSLASLREWMASHAEDVDANPAAWCAMELALLDLLATETSRTVDALLGLPPLAGRFTYSAVLGDAEPDQFHAMAEEYRRRGLADFKVKLSGRLEHDRAKVDVFRRWDPPPRSVRADANNLWDGCADAARFLRAMDYPFVAVEEPIRANRLDEMAALAMTVHCPIVLDESFVRVGQLDALRGNPSRWVINLRVSKMGGLLRSLQVAAAAREAHIRIICGAQVGETSLLTRAALSVANAAVDALVAQEGAFGTFLLERDICDPPLMFGAGGILDVTRYPTLTGPGFGLVIERLTN